MIPYPRIDPVIVHIGPLALRWYGLMYLLGFFASFYLVKKQIAEELGTSDRKRLAAEQALLDGIIVALVAGVILGGRLGYVLFYNLSYFLEHPAEILATWHGGMSFHGGAVGVMIAGWLYCRLHNTDFFKWSDRFAVTVPIGLGLGRIGNFINGELYGRPSDVPWAMIFPDGGFVPRHPSQLYEAFLEGIVLFSMLWPLRRKKWPSGRKTALFFIGYGIIRFFVEFLREPDPQLGFLALGWVTMGQVLSIALIFLGIVLWTVRKPLKLEE
ncbi:MAG: prolipoprotein diacylglyceryl transferase [Thermodesulfatator sp.]|nr:MAG: prolipoprotein diacylglyceryl transferase [Thermodesulfatator sp.]